MSSLEQCNRARRWQRIEYNVKETDGPTSAAVVLSQEGIEKALLDIGETRREQGENSGGASIKLSSVFFSILQSDSRPHQHMVILYLYF